MDARTTRYIAYTILFIIMAIVWIGYYEVGISNFSKDSAIAIFSSAIEGMSALLSISIAVFIFRIQSLENRNQQLEESTLNFIFQTTHLSYPKWIPSVEEDIRSGAITKRYYEYRIADLDIGQRGYNKIVEEYANDRDTQQKRLEETLNLHSGIEQTIERIRVGVYYSVGLLILPILISFYLLTVSDVLNLTANFTLASVVVLTSIMGIASLVMTVFESTIAPD